MESVSPSEEVVLLGRSSCVWPAMGDRALSSCQGEYSYLNANELEEKTSKVKVWTFAIDVRRDASKGLQTDSEDKVLYHYTNQQALESIPKLLFEFFNPSDSSLFSLGLQAFSLITSLKGSKVIASLLSDRDSNFGHGVYVTSKAPHKWRPTRDSETEDEYAKSCREQILLNNYFPSEEVWKEEKDTRDIEWPSQEELQGDVADLPKSLLSTRLGNKLKRKFVGRSDYCIPIICDRHSARDRPIRFVLFSAAPRETAFACSECLAIAFPA